MVLDSEFGSASQRDVPGVIWPASEMGGMSMRPVREELQSWVPIILVWLAFVALGLTIVGVLFELSE